MRFLYVIKDKDFFQSAETFKNTLVNAFSMDNKAKRAFCGTKKTSILKNYILKFNLETE